MHLQSENHSDQVLAALQNVNDDGCEILLVGKDNVSSSSDSLWILSPLVRSIIDSLGNIRDNLIILPDFSYEEIKTGLGVTEGNRGEILIFNSSTKHLLETLGMDLRNCWTGNHDLEIRTENVDERVDSVNGSQDDDDDRDDIQKQLLAQNSDFDSSNDEEDTEHDDDTDDENDDEGLQDQLMQDQDLSESDDEDIQNQLIKDQDLSDSDSNDDDESQTTRFQNDNLIDSKEKVKEFLDNQFIQDTLMLNQDISNDEEEGADPPKKTTVSVRKGTINVKHSKHEITDLQQQKLKEVEELLVEVNGGWKCKECKKTFPDRGRIRRHAEIHVSGLSYPCDHCSIILTNRASLHSHRKKCRRIDMMNTQSKHKGIKYPCDHCSYQASYQKDLQRHIQTKHKGTKYPCNQCDYHAKRKDSLQVHIQSKHEGVKYSCNQCDYQATTQSSLRRHNKMKHEGIKYTCNHCEYQATIQSSLKAHKAAVHSDTSIKCDNCDYQTKWRQNYLKHKKSHVKLK